MTQSLPVAQSLPVDWTVTSGCKVTSGGLGESLPVGSDFRLRGHFRGTGESLPVGSRGLKTMVVTSISHMGEMRDSDWSRPNLLRSDWLPTI